MASQLPILHPPHRWGTPGTSPLLFLHANSYSASMYEDLLKPLFSTYEVLAPDLPGHGDSRWNGRISSWQDVADNLIEYFDSQPPEKPFIGIGHSIGGIVLMLMSIQRPQWFERLIFLDPVMLPKGILLLMRGLRVVSMTHLIPLAKAAKRRRTRFPDRQAALAHFGSKKVFARWTPNFLEAYVDTALFETGSGELQLCCSPQVESSIYQSIPLNVWSLPKKLHHPSLFLVGAFSDTINARGFKRLASSKGNHVVKKINGGHLFPFEKPAETQKLIEEFLA